MQVFHAFISGQPLISKLLYMGHRFFGGLIFLLWHLTTESMPEGGARGQNLEHFLNSFIFKFFMSLYLENH